MSSISERSIKHRTVSKTCFEFWQAIREEFPNSEGTVVCAFDIVYSYSDKDTGEPVADIVYYRGGTSNLSMFGYDYQLVWRK